MSQLRAETAHAINGVNGRLFALNIPPAPWKAGTFANQTWLSESRPVSGYAVLQVHVRFDDNCRNGHNTFAITADFRHPGHRDIAAGGCMHDDITKVFPELAHLIQWHLVSTDGPMHYIANTVYHAKENGPTHAWVYFKGQGATDPLGLGSDGEKERLLGYLDADKARAAETQPGYTVKWDEKTVKVRNLDHARSTAVWPDATDEQLQAPAAELAQALAERLPALLAAFRADIEAAGFIWSAPTA
jgi:hypothetical protein